MSIGLFDRFLIPLLKRGLLMLDDKSMKKCKKCKGDMVNTVSYLYLLPLIFDHGHEESAQYYLQKAIKIDSMEQIPKGNRACYMNVFQCQNCADKLVSIVDFLKVREDAVIKGGGVYPYELFDAFFRRE